MIAEEVAARAFAAWEPARPPLSHIDFSRRTLLPGGPLAGTAYDPNTDPVQRYMLEQFDSGKWESITWGAPPQIAGKTTVAIVVTVLRAALECGSMVGYGLPTLADLDRGWQTKLAPTFKAAGFGDYLPKQGPGSKNGRPPSIVFENPAENRAPMGGIVFLAGKARQVTARVIAIDELDAWRDADGTPRWSDIEDAWARADSFQGAALRIGTGTFECDDPARSILLPLINERGTGTRLHHKCRHCGAYTPIAWDAFTYEYRTIDGGPDLKHAAATAAYACTACGVRWTEDDRRASILSGVFAHKGQSVDAAGIVQGSPPGTKHLGVLTHALDCILTTIGAIAEKHAAARYALEQHGNHEPMRKFSRYQKCECYTGDIQTDADAKETQHTHRTLAARSERTAWAEVREDSDDDKRWSRYSAASIPEPVAVICGGIDLQRNRLYAQLTGIDKERRSYDLAWSIERSRPSTDGKEPPPWAPGELADALSRASDWLEEIGGPLFRGGVVDVSDGVTQGEAAEWLSSHPKWNAIQGEDHLPTIKGDGRIQPRTSLVCWDTQWRNGMGSYRVVTDLAQQTVAESYRIDPAAPGAGLLPGPMRAGNAYLRHLTAVGWTTTDAGRRIWGAIKGSGRWDYADARAYATAVGLAILMQDLAPPPPPSERIDLPILRLEGIRL